MAMNVPFGRYFAVPDLGYWYPVQRPDGDGERPFGVGGYGLAPRADQTAPMPQAQVPAPNAPGYVFSDTPWFDPYGMRGSYAALLTSPRRGGGLLGGDY